MRYLLFEYTRNLREDYAWKIKPHGLSGDFSKVVQKFIFLRDRMRDDESIDWSKIVFFMRYENSNIACQILANGEDYVGRTIYSMRGLVSLGNDYRALLGIPDLINTFYQSGCPTIMDEFEGNYCLEDKEYTIEDEINPLVYYDVSQLETNLNCSSFRRLIGDIRNRECKYGMIVGPGAETIYSHMGNFQLDGMKVFDKYYDNWKTYEEPITLPLKAQVIKNDIENYGVGMVSDNNALLFLKIYREGKDNGSYEWILQRQSDGLTIKSSKRCFVKKLELESLVIEGQKLRRYYSMIGFNVV